MAVMIRIPTTLRPMTGGASEVEAKAGRLADVLASLEAVYPGFQERLLDNSGQLHRFVNVFVNDEDVRFLDGLDTAVQDGETIAIIPAVAGGGF